MRTFISINFPEEVVEQIKNIQNALPEFIGKKIEKENLHLTLKFLGEVEEENLERIKEELAKIRFFEFKSHLTDLGVFSKEYIRIIWMSIFGCEKLQKQIDLSLEGLFKKEQRFMGHLTIARVKNVEDKNKFIQELEKIYVPKISFDVKEFCLVKSELTKKGPIYSIIEGYLLKS